LLDAHRLLILEEKPMKRFAALVIALVSLCTPALAKDLCITHGVGVVLVFSRLKIPTKPSTSAPVTGLAVPGGLPVTGTIVRDSGGALSVGLTLFSTGGSTCFERAVVDETLTGTGTLECSPSFGDSAVDWDPIDCALVKP
jgi:hypothetical protein